MIGPLDRSSVVVTGASGFVGRNLAARLEERGAHVWRAVSRQLGASVKRTLVGDLENPTYCIELLGAADPAIIFHAAGTTGGGSDAMSSLRHIRGNVITTGNLFSAIQATGVRPRVVLISSAAVYGAAQSPVVEEAELRPTTAYGASKVALELIGRQHYLAHHTDVVTVRPFNLVGRDQPDHLLVSEVCRRIAIAERTGADTVEVGDRRPRRDFLDIADAVEALMALAATADAGTTYNIGSGTALPVGEIVDHLVAMAETPIRVATSESRGEGVYDSFPSIERLVALTGWEPNVPIEQSLLRCLEAARELVSRGSK